MVEAADPAGSLRGINAETPSTRSFRPPGKNIPSLRGFIVSFVRFGKTFLPAEKFADRKMGRAKGSGYFCF